METMRTVRIALAAAGCLGACPPAAEGGAPPSSDFPTRPIRLLVPSAPGGGTDIIARLVAQGLNESWGQAVVVDNRGGAGGIPGVTLVAKGSAADGYTMLLGSNGHLTFAPALYRNLAYDPLRDLAPIALVANQPFVVAVHPSLAAVSIRELIALAKSRPKSISYGSGGSGSASHLGIELLQATGGMSLLHVPYKGTGPGLSALIAGEIQVLLAGLATMLPQINSGRVKVLAVTGSQRAKVAPEIPTVAESGVPGFAFDVWYGMVYPGGTARALVLKTSAEINRLLKAPAVSERFTSVGLEPAGSTPEEFTELIRREIPRWQKVARDANLKVD